MKIYDWGGGGANLPKICGSRSKEWAFQEKRKKRSVRQKALTLIGLLVKDVDIFLEFFVYNHWPVG